MGVHCRVCPIEVVGCHWYHLRAGTVAIFDDDLRSFGQQASARARRPGPDECRLPTDVVAGTTEVLACAIGRRHLGGREGSRVGLSPNWPRSSNAEPAPEGSAAVPSQRTGPPVGPVTRHEVQRYLVQATIRWSPLLVATVALALIVALAPPVLGSAPVSSSAGAPGTRETYGVAGGRGGSTSSSAGGFASSSASGAGTGSDSASGLPGTSSASSISAAGGAGGGSPSTAAAIGAPGQTVAGAHCGPGVKQFTWSVYAPPCVPAFSGDNGGATSPGVTGKTITLTFAEPSSSTMELVDTFAGYADINVPEYVSDMETYMKYFNTQFELYGRHVVLKPFTAQGNFLLEDDGQDLSGAEADAETAASIPAFADVTFPLLAAAPYLQDLAQVHVISTSGLGEPDQWFAQYAPYAYSEVPTGTAGAEGFGNLMCTRMAGLDATFSPQFSHDKRVFGLITPETPQYQEVAQELMGTAAKCGVKFPVWEQYTLGSLQTYQSQAVSIVAKMKAEGVTTVVCGCDPIFPIEISQAAAQQDYYPEWVAIAWEDPITQEYDQAEWAHAISEEGQTPPPSSLNAYKIFEEASGGKPPEEQYFYVAYYTLLMVYDALQLAGPDLTPSSFQHGWFSLPETPLGQAGIWSGGNDAYSLNDVTTQLGWYDPNATSYQDDKAGAWEDCGSGKYYYLQDQNGWGAPHTQLNCFGR